MGSVTFRERKGVPCVGLLWLANCPSCTADAKFGRSLEAPQEHFCDRRAREGITHRCGPMFTRPRRCSPLSNERNHHRIFAWALLVTRCVNDGPRRKRFGSFRLPAFTRYIADAKCGYRAGQWLAHASDESRARRRRGRSHCHPRSPRFDRAMAATTRSCEGSGAARKLPRRARSPRTRAALRLPRPPPCK